MRRLTVVAALLFCCALLEAQQTAPQGNTPPPDSAQPNASQESGATKPEPDSGTSGAQRPHGQRFQRGPGVMGTITAINGNAVTLKSFDGTTATVNLTPQTEFRKDQQPAKLTDFKVGDMVFVRGEPAGEHIWTATVMGTRSEASRRFREGMGKDFIVGKIQSIDGLNLTIARFDGVSQTITVNENTSFHKNGESVTLADFAPGDRVFVRGETKNGVFVPAMLNSGQPGRTGMMGGPPQQAPAGGTQAPPKEGPPKEGEGKESPHQ